jgi:KilA-N domain
MKIIMHEANGLKIGQRHEDGYINLTSMAQASGKLIADYLRLNTTKGFIDELSMDMGIPISKLIEIRKGKPAYLQGTWAHPQVAINCGQWCSPRFAVLVSRWVVDWMTTGKRPISQTENYADSLLPTAKAYIESSQSLNRTIHTAIHQQTDSLKQALEVLFRQEAVTTESNSLSQLQTPTKEATVRITVDLAESMHRKLSLLSARTGKKKAEIVRFLLDEALKGVED